MNEEANFASNSPIAETLRVDRLPHVWCPGCGIGTAVTSFTDAVKKSGVDPDKVVVVSGIGCTGRVAGYVNYDSFHTTHGRAIPFATGLKLANPDLHVIVFSGDGDLMSIGGNHLIHAARRNIDLMVILNNNFIYGMTGGQVTPTTPAGANASTSPYGNFEYPFNLPLMMDACGAGYVARWTSMHVRRTTTAIQEMFDRRGFRFLEVITPCTTLYGRRNRLGDTVDMVNFYHDNCEIKHGADTRTIDIDFQEKFAVGKFVDRERPTFLDAMNEHYNQVFGDDYVLYGGIESELKEQEAAKEKEREKIRKASA